MKEFWNRKKFWICLLALTLALMPVSALAAKLPSPGKDFYYLDEADVLSQETEGEIFFCNQLLQEQCGAQIVIAAMNDIGGADIFDYATDLAEAWGIGSKSEQNGFLLLMTIEDENYYATTGSGLRHIFPASTLKEMFDDYLEGDFAARRYDAGAKKFFEAVFSRVADYYNLTLQPSDGVAAYQSYIASHSGASSFGGASGGGARGSWAEDDYYGDDFYYEERGVGLAGIILTLIVLFLVMRMLSRVMVGRGSSFWLWHLPFFFPPVRGPRYGYRYDEPGPGPRGPRRRPPRGGGFGGGGFGGFGGGFGGGGGGFTGGGGRGFGGGGFGGARGGGGGGFGGGAGRGRH